MNAKKLLVALAHRILARHDKGLRRYESILFAALAAETERLEVEPCPASSGVNLVLGMATNYDKEKIAPFVLSLRNNGYTGDIILLVSKVDAETARFYREQNVITKFYWDAHFIPLERQMARYFTFYGVLRDAIDHGRAYDQVLISDTRDVIFQGDPFAGAHPVDIATFYEEASVTIGQCYYNNIWVSECYGEKIRQELAGKPIANVGTVMGSGLGIMRYLLLLQAESFRVLPSARHKLSVDQAAHNRLVQQLGLPAFANGDHIWTLGHVPPEEVVITRDNKVTSASQTRLCPILHQYDRHPQLRTLANTLYGESSATRQHAQTEMELT